MSQGKDIGNRVAERMAALQMDAAALAQAIGVTEDTIYRLLRGETVKQWIRLGNIAKALRTTPNTLLGVESPASEERRIALLTAAFQGLGLPEPLDRTLAGIYREALDTTPAPQGSVSELDRLRLSAEILKRQSAAR